MPSAKSAFLNGPGGRFQPVIDGVDLSTHYVDVFQILFIIRHNVLLSPAAVPAKLSETKEAMLAVG